MATWGEILTELRTPALGGSVPPNVSPFDFVRRKYLSQLAAKTKRNVIIYASRWTQGGGDPQVTSITPEDVQGFMEVISGLSGDALDLVLHSPGGSAEATEALVTYLRSKFVDLRIIVPHAAMSAATMLACAGNRILMGRHSFLGPIDPQVILQTELGGRSVPAYAILEQFKYAQAEVKRDPGLLPAWLPILRQYGPALIVQCQLHQQLAETLVADWLARFMFGGDQTLAAKATQIAKDLSNHAQFKSHNRFVSKDEAKRLGLLIEDLEADQSLQDAVLSVFHATTHTFSATPAAKIIENHQGKAFIKAQGPQLVMLPQGAPVLPSSPSAPPGPP
ncbi:MAG: serine protease [Myxococcota bacterium]|nr:serine protease [Myxococcota bacterium]